MAWRGTLLALALIAGEAAVAQVVTLPPSALPGAAPEAPPAAMDPGAVAPPGLPIRTLGDAAPAGQAAAPGLPGPTELPPAQLESFSDEAAAPPGAVEPPAEAVAPGAVAGSVAVPGAVGPEGIPLRTLPQIQPQAPAQPQAPPPPSRVASTAPAGVTPFSPAITVNNGAITWYDIDQRAALLAALGARGDVRKIAVDQLTEDAVKIQAAKALQIELPEGAVMAGVDEFAAQRGISVDDVYRVLSARGIDNQTMQDFVEAGLYWREVVQSRFRQKSMPSEDDLDIALTSSENAPVEIVQLSEIALPFEERGEQETTALAERLSRQSASAGAFAAAARQYSRSSTAGNGGRMDPMPAAQLPPAIRSQVLLLGAGGVTRPIPISGGLAILRVDSLRLEAPGARPADVTDEEVRNQIRQQIFQQRINTFGQGYLQELLRDAVIVQR
ncbi:peptidylprolyl isomerase [Amaricoccus sp.]|uniref:peptidylprolyl isomerase n=1 Tax=Amaricoccus sp. TaxID=1872485 RepID=UPI001B6C9630|nr:peptidylprolyl isomerase [Amaricoccus sp.]MBP7002848.1 peptidylprolyl isomerase [Amaricoccus sp.]